MSEITHRTIETNGIRMHVAEQGTGPLVLMCHGFPESWYSWRHQLAALADAGFHAVAPDMRGYGQTDAPADIESYTLLHLVGDMVGLLDALSEKTAVIAGHDWGAPVAWHSALLRPDRFRGVIGLSVPFRPRGTAKPSTLMPQTEHEVFYQIYFQTPGVAEAELQRDVRSTMRRMAYSGSGDAASHPGAADGGRRDRDGQARRRLPRSHDRSALSPRVDQRGGHRLLHEGVLAHRLPGRAELVPEHRPQLGAAGALGRRPRHRPRALRGRRSRPGRPVPRDGSAHPEPVEVRAEAAAHDHAAGLRPLDPAGARARGQRRHARVLEGAVRWRGPGAADAGECFLALTFGTNHGRLRALKAVYDPTSLFRVNADVAP